MALRHLRHKLWLGTVLMTVLSLGLCRANAQPQVVDYRKCLEEKGVDPVEYVFRLFEQADVVKLTERDHRDITQYDFTCSLLADSRFADRIGRPSAVTTTPYGRLISDGQFESKYDEANAAMAAIGLGLLVQKAK